MISINLSLDGDGAWPELNDKKVAECETIKMAVLEGGMSSGLPSVTIRLDDPDGDIFVAQTSLRCLVTTVKAIMARYGDPTLLPD